MSVSEFEFDITQTEVTINEEGTAAVVRCLVPGRAVLVLNMSRAALHRACIQAEIALKHRRNGRGRRYTS
jgi:hypothetical protein